MLPRRLPVTVYGVQSSSQSVFIDKPTRPHNVMLKVVPVLLHGPGGTIDTHAILDDGSKRTMVLQLAADKLQLEGKPETMLLQTVRDDIVECRGQSSSLQLSPRDQPEVKCTITGAFSAHNLCLFQYTYPVEALQQRYHHLRRLQLPTIKDACPLVLISSDCTELIVPRQPIKFGPQGAPVAINTNLGWTLQGPAGNQKQLPGQQVFKT